MLSTTVERVEKNTSSALHSQFEEELRENISMYMKADRRDIDRRLEALDKEWNIERMIELEAPVMIGLGALLGLTHNRKWFGLSLFAASMVIVHNTQGWYPLLRVFQRLGFRSQRYIEDERNALRVLRKDHHQYIGH
jgi:hypothetical protein